MGAGAPGGKAGDQQGSGQRTALLLFSLLEEPPGSESLAMLCWRPHPGVAQGARGLSVQVVSAGDLFGRMMGTLP